MGEWYKQSEADEEAFRQSALEQIKRCLRYIGEGTGVPEAKVGPLQDVSQGMVGMQKVDNVAPSDTI